LSKTLKCESIAQVRSSPGLRAGGETGLPGAGGRLNCSLDMSTLLLSSIEFNIIMPIEHAFDLPNKKESAIWQTLRLANKLD